jgi:hypothetical protein
MDVDPQRTRYPGSRDPSWWLGFEHRWLRRFERPHAQEPRRRVWPRVKHRLSTMFNPHWLP